MSNIESYDGLCGIIHLYATSDKQVRCHHSLGHHGKHSWADKKIALHIVGGTENRHYAEDKFIESVLASLKK